MKKIGILFIVLIFFSACAKKEEKELPVPEYPYTIVSKAVDMSAYEGVSSTRHNFRIITISELANTVDQKSSGVFFLGRTNCGCCQDVCKYLNEVALELNVTVYYINVYNEDEPLDQQDMIDALYKYLDPILNEDEGKKVLLTPQVFSIVNGEFYGSQICVDGYNVTEDSSIRQIEKFKDSYRAIMAPFAVS